MRSEVEVTPRLHKVGTVVLVARLDVHEYLDLDQGLRVEALLVTDDLDGHHALLLVVEGLDHLLRVRVGVRVRVSAPCSRRP